jgi:hypothetical protein
VNKGFISGIYLYGEDSWLGDNTKNCHNVKQTGDVL